MHQARMYRMQDPVVVQYMWLSQQTFYELNLLVPGSQKYVGIETDGTSDKLAGVYSQFGYLKPCSYPTPPGYVP